MLISNSRNTSVKNAEDMIRMSAITMSYIENHFPQIAKAFREEGAKAGAEAERKRIQDMEAQSMPGHEALIQGLKFDGKTTGDMAAAAILKAEKEQEVQRVAQAIARGANNR